MQDALLQSQGQFDYEPNGYSGYGFKENVSLADGSAVTGQDIALTAVTPAVFGGMYTPPAGYTVAQKMVAIEFSQGGLMLIEFDTTSSETFSYNTPNISGATLALASAAIKGAAYSVVVNTGLAVDATNVTTSSPAATEELAFTSTGVATGTEFLFTAVPDAVHLLVLASGASEYSSSVPSYIFLTAGNSAAIPDLHSFGLNLPTSTDYTWLVYGLGPYADVEAASAGLCCMHQWASLSLGGLPLNLNLVNSNTGGFVTSFGPGHFTTAP